MDISTIVPNERELELLHPATKERIGLSLWLVCTQDDRVKKVARAKADARLARRGRPITTTEALRDEIEILCAAVTRWEWSEGATFNGEQLEFTPENVRKIMHVEWIREQVDRELSETDRFFENS